MMFLSVLRLNRPKHCKLINITAVTKSMKAFSFTLCIPLAHLSNTQVSKNFFKCFNFTKCVFNLIPKRYVCRVKKYCIQNSS